MGRGKRHKQNGRKRVKENTWDNPENRILTYAETPRENEMFFNYYKEQKLVPENEWDTFCKYLREPLPASFRISASGKQSVALLHIIKSQCLQELVDTSPVVTGEGEGESTSDSEQQVIAPPHPLPWYPGDMAWSLSLPRRFIRRHPPLQRLHKFLIVESACGTISRQEEVSMIPPLLLDVRPHHKVLDMCAAPGSKTAQIIECLHGAAAGSDDNTGIPPGFVVANDVDNKRCYMLVHQAKRLQSPSVIITNHDAKRMPNLKLINKRTGKEETVLYDRILCDVPCTGDGTMRKNIDCWAKWHPNTGKSLHNLQLKILRRAVEMLSIGGRIVYSTCSFNPIENEAVVCAMLRACEGSVHLVDVGDSLPNLIRRPGMSVWKVNSQFSKEYYDKYENVPENQRHRIVESMFPLDVDAMQNDVQIEKCLRLLPHDQNTGGFFVAVLEKTRPLPWTSTSKKFLQDIGEGVDGSGSPSQSNTGDEESTTSSPSPAPKRFKKFHGFKEDPFIFFTADEPVWPEIKDFYKVKEEFDPTCLMTRCKEGRKRNVYLVSPVLRDIVIHNRDRVKIINTGVRILTRGDQKGVSCSFRLAQDGLESWLPLLQARVLDITCQEDVVTLLTHENPFLSRMSSDTRHALSTISTGSMVFRFHRAGDGNAPDVTFDFCGLKGLGSVRSFVPKAERMHCLRLMGIDTSPYEEDVSGKNGGSGKGATADNDATSEDKTSHPETTTEEQATDNSSENTNSAPPSKISEHGNLETPGN